MYGLCEDASAASVPRLFALTNASKVHLITRVREFCFNHVEADLVREIRVSMLGMGTEPANHP